MEPWFRCPSSTSAELRWMAQARLGLKATARMALPSTRFFVPTGWRFWSEGGFTLPAMYVVVENTARTGIMAGGSWTNGTTITDFLVWAHILARNKELPLLNCAREEAAPRGAPC